MTCTGTQLGARDCLRLTSWKSTEESSYRQPSYISPSRHVNREGHGLSPHGLIQVVAGTRTSPRSPNMAQKRTFPRVPWIGTSRIGLLSDDRSLSVWITRCCVAWPALGNEVAVKDMDQPWPLGEPGEIRWARWGRSPAAGVGPYQVVSVHSANWSTSWSAVPWP